MHDLQNSGIFSKIVQVFSVLTVAFLMLFLAHYWHKQSEATLEKKRGAEYMIAMAKLKAGSHKEGVEVLERLMEHGDHLYTAFAGLQIAGFYLSQQNFDKAIAVYTKLSGMHAATRAVRSYAAFMNIVTSLIAKKIDDKSAISALEMYIAQKPAEGVVYKNMGIELLACLHADVGSSEKAMEYFQMLLQDSEKISDALMERARFLQSAIS